MVAVDVQIKGVPLADRLIRVEVVLDIPVGRVADCPALRRAMHEALLRGDDCRVDSHCTCNAKACTDWHRHADTAGHDLELNRARPGAPDRAWRTVTVVEQAVVFWLLEARGMTLAAPLVFKTQMISAEIAGMDETAPGNTADTQRRRAIFRYHRKNISLAADADGRSALRPIGLGRIGIAQPTGPLVKVLAIEKCHGRASGGGNILQNKGLWRERQGSNGGTSEQDKTQHFSFPIVTGRYYFDRYTARPFRRARIMFFKNLCIYRLPLDFNLPPPELEAKLEGRPLQPCGHFDMTTRGWVPVGPTARLLHTIGTHQLIALGVEQKLLPGSIIRQVAADRAVEIAAEQGYPVGRNQMRELKLRVTEELRAQALVKRGTTHAWIDRENGWFIVDAASITRAEELVDTLRDTLGSFAVVPIDAARSPQAAMASWLGVGNVGNYLNIDDDLELQAADLSRATIRYSHHAFDNAQVRQYFSAGFIPTRLGLTWNARISFVLTAKFQVKRVQFLEMEKEGETEADLDPQEQFDIDFAVMSGELAKLLKDLLAALGGEAERQVAA
jgi:recombination associated protein RdgC